MKKAICDVVVGDKTDNYEFKKVELRMDGFVRCIVKLNSGEHECRRFFNSPNNLVKISSALQEA